MVIGTRGINFYPEFTIPINYYDSVEALHSTNDGSCFRLVFIEDGIGSLLINHEKIAVLPFTCLCLNEQDRLSEIDITGMTLHILCFLPAAINGRLTLDKMNTNEGLTVSDAHDKQFLLPFIPQFRTFSSITAIPVTTGRRATEIILNLKELLLIQNDSWPCLTRSYMIELLFLVERTFSFYKEKGENTNIEKGLSIDDIIAYIHNNYMNKITIDDLTKRYNTNRTTLSKEFRTATGYTVISYIIKIRVEIAAGMLRDTAMKVEFIIERVGFSNITHFNKVFKEYTKCLPKEYRKKYSSYH